MPDRRRPPGHVTSRQRRRSLNASADGDGEDSTTTFAIQAYEADIIRGRAQEAADVATRSEGRIPSGRLVRWEGRQSDGDQDIWIDRYDVLHLLTAIPSRPPSVEPASPRSLTGWSDLPSDVEDTFFFSGDEGETYVRAKKRRKVESGREERLRALEEASKGVKSSPDVSKPANESRDSDEEPPEHILQLMNHTLTSLMSSPNPQILELRILTHHSGDPRFSFLKGRYRRRWEQLKIDRAVKEQAAQKEKEVDSKKETLAGLMGDYGDSDESEDEVDAAGGASPVRRSADDIEGSPPPPPPPPRPDEEPLCASRDLSPAPSVGYSEDPIPGPSKQVLSEDCIKQRRREKAKAWAARRDIA